MTHPNSSEQSIIAIIAFYLTSVPIDRNLPSPTQMLLLLNIKALQERIGPHLHTLSSRTK